MRNGSARVVLGAAVASMVGCASKAPEVFQLPPPPTEATASCAYPRVTSQFPPIDLPTSTLWLDGLGRVIRVDGWEYDDEDFTRETPEAYDLMYDTAGHLAEVRSKHQDRQITYSADQILETYAPDATWTYQLIDGRVVHSDGPPDAMGTRQTWDHTYDAAGRVASEVYGHVNGTNYTWVGTDEYTYDAKDRILSSRSSGTAYPGGELSNYSFSYTDTPDRVVVAITDLHGPNHPSLVQRWTFDFDASHRLLRDAVDGNGDGFDDFWDDFRYLDGEIDVSSRDRGDTTLRAVGACAAP